MTIIGVLINYKEFCMGELLKTMFITYAALALFTGCFFGRCIFVVIKKTTNMGNQKLKIALRSVICSVIAIFWLYVFIYMNMYPRSLAYYEYKNDVADETTGTISDITYVNKEIIHIRINNTNYTMAYSSKKPYKGIGTDIDEGDTVKIKFGVNSKYIFDIYESDIGT